MKKTSPIKAIANSKLFWAIVSLLASLSIWVYVTSVEYNTTKQITDTPEQERSIDFSPDGRSLVADVVHGTTDSVTLDDVPAAEPSGHKLDPVEEIVEYILHGESKTGGQAGGDHGHRLGRNIEQADKGNDVHSPYDEPDNVVGKGEVDLVLPEKTRGRLADLRANLVDAVQGLGQILDEPENEEESDGYEYLVQGQADESGIQEWRHDRLLADLCKVEHPGCQEYA